MYCPVVSFPTAPAPYGVAKGQKVGNVRKLEFRGTKVSTAARVAIHGFTDLWDRASPVEEAHAGCNTGP